MFLAYFSESASISIDEFIISDINLAVFSIDISKLLAEFITSPIVFSELAVAIKASQVSFTKLKSLVGVKNQVLIYFSFIAI